MKSTEAKPLECETRSHEEIDFRELIRILWVEKILIASFTGCAAVLSVVFALFMNDVYRAQTVLAAADSEQTNSMVAQLGGAAALLGVNVNSGNDNDINTAIATLRSHQFLTRFIDDNDLLIPLFATKWDKARGTSVVDERIYDPQSQSWLADHGQPSLMDGYRTLSKVLSVVGPDRNTGLIAVSISWQNPVEAAQWVNQLVRELNREIRARDVREASSAIAFLQRQLEGTQLVDMQRVLYQLIESQTRITMLADVRDEYVFRVIDPAVVPDLKSAPRRALICIIGTLAGLMFALLIVFGKRIFKTRN